MSRFSDEYDEELYPNAGALWAANAKRALSGKRGRKALTELREALRALPEKRLISGALCTVRGTDRPDARRLIEKEDEWAARHGRSNWYRDEISNKVHTEGEGVCAIGAYLWFKKVKAGADPQAAFDELPTLLDTDASDWDTAEAGKNAGLTFTLAWDLAYRNDETFSQYEMTPERRHEAFMKWLDEQLEGVPVS